MGKNRLVWADGLFFNESADSELYLVTDLEKYQKWEAARPSNLDFLD
jgi:hypothetical protein